MGARQGKQRTLRRSAYVGTTEAAGRLQVSQATIQRWIDSGVLPCIRTLGGHRRIQREDLDRFVANYGQNPASRADTGIRRILFVGKNTRLIRGAIRWLRKKYPEVSAEAVSDGIEALLRIGRQPPDLLIFHGVIPGLEGVDVARRIKRESRLRSIDIRMTSGGNQRALTNLIADRIRRI